MGQLISGLNLRPGEALVPELGFNLAGKLAYMYINIYVSIKF